MGNATAKLPIASRVSGYSWFGVIDRKVISAGFSHG
jgi:hypothetical protein